MRLPPLVCCLFITFGVHGAVPALDVIRFMEISVHRYGDMEVFHGEGKVSEARQLADMLERAALFFSRELGVKEAFSLAFLEQENWARVTQAPYGMPFVSGPPYVVVFSASEDHELYRLVEQTLGGSELAREVGLENDQLIRLFIALIGFHELGHVYARESGLQSPEKWIFEFNATYLAYAFLARNRPEWAEIWVKAAAIIAEQIQPQHRSLEDFEELYVRVGTESYAWFQCVFLEQAAAVFEKEGLEWLPRMRGRECPENPDVHHLYSMEGLHPGFVAWAREHGMMERR